MGDSGCSHSRCPWRHTTVAAGNDCTAPASVVQRGGYRAKALQGRVLLLVRMLVDLLMFSDAATAVPASASVFVRMHGRAGVVHTGGLLPAPLKLISLQSVED